MEASIVERRLKKSEIRALKERKMKEIEKKLVYMVIMFLFFLNSVSKLYRITSVLRVLLVPCFMPLPVQTELLS